MTRYLFTVMFLSLLFAGLVNYRNVMKRSLGLVKTFILPDCLWILMFLGIVNIGVLNQGEYFKIGQMKQLAITLPVIFIMIVLILLRSQVISWLNVTNIFVLLYGLTGILSGIYSPEPLYSTYKATLVIIAVLIGLLVLTYDPPFIHIHNFVVLNYFFYFVMMLSYILGVIISPEKGLILKEGALMEMVKGWIIDSNPNTVGFVAGFLCLLFIYRSLSICEIKEKIMYNVFSLNSFILLIYAQSRTCIAGFFVSVILLLMYKRKYISIAALIISSLLFLTVNTFDSFEEHVVTYYRRGQSDKQFETWSGRLTTWNQVWDKYKEAPIVGYGMAAGVKSGTVSKSLEGSHMHSSYFEILLNSGLIGFIPWILGLIFVTANLLKRSFSRAVYELLPLKQELSVLLLFCLIRTVSGTTFVVFDNTFLFYVSVILFTTYMKSTSSPEFVKVNK